MGKICVGGESILCELKRFNLRPFGLGDLGVRSCFAQKLLCCAGRDVRPSLFLLPPTWGELGRGWHGGRRSHGEWGLERARPCQRFRLKGTVRGSEKKGSRSGEPSSQKKANPGESALLAPKGQAVARASSAPPSISSQKLPSLALAPVHRITYEDSHSLFYARIPRVHGAASARSTSRKACVPPDGSSSVPRCPWP